MAKSKSSGLISGKPDMKGAMSNPQGFKSDVEATKKLSPSIHEPICDEIKGKGMK